MKRLNVLPGGLFILILFTLLPLHATMILHSRSETSSTFSLEPRKEQAMLQGLSFFPLGIHGIQNSTEIWTSWKHRFNTVFFGFAESEDFNELDIEDMLFTCDVLGMKVLFDTSYYLRTNALDDLRDLVLRLVDHPSIYAWYLVDIPSLGNNGMLIDEKMIQNAVNTIQQVDNRPTFVQLSSESIFGSLWENSFATIPNFVDIISVAPFPNMPSVNHSRVSTWIDMLAQYNAGRAKIWTALSTQSSGSGLNKNDSSILTDPEYMMDAVLALQRGVEGLHWGSFGVSNFGVHAFPALWNVLGRIIRRVSQVAPIIIGRENEMFVFPLAKTIDASYAKRGNQTVLFLANHDYYWNGTETEWKLHSITITLDIRDLESLSIIEPSGPKPLDFQYVGSTLSFNITINGGVILLLESPGLVSLLEFQSSSFIIFLLLPLIIIFCYYRVHKKHSILDFS